MLTTSSNRDDLTEVVDQLISEGFNHIVFTFLNSPIVHSIPFNDIYRDCIIDLLIVRILVPNSGDLLYVDTITQHSDYIGLTMKVSTRY